jgi:hypothetical protein
MTRKDFASSVGSFLTSWKGIAAAVTLVLGMVGADGRKTATALQTHRSVEHEVLLREQHVLDSTEAAEIRVLRRQLNALLDRMDASNLSDCLIQRNAVVRRELECGRLESEAGINR